MNSMDQMTAIEIVKIIKAASVSGVTELKLGNLELKFGAMPQTAEQAQEIHIPAQEIESKLTQLRNQRTIDEDYDLFNNPSRWDEELRSDQVEEEA